MAWPISEEQLDRWTDRVRQAFSIVKQVGSRRKVRYAALAVVLPLFAVALVLAWRRAGFDPSSLRVGPTLIVVASIPFAVLASTWQLHAMTRAGGVIVDWWSALRVVTVGTLSSLLPVSSGTVVRGSAVVYWGVPPRAAGVAVAYDTLLWIGVSLLYAGLAAFFVPAVHLAIPLALGGAVLLPMAMLLGRSLPGEGGRLELLMARVVGIGVEVVRLIGCFFALGYPLSFVEASTLSAATPLASIFFFLPGGLGVKEGFTSAVAAAMGVSAATAFLAAVLNRLVGLTVLLAWEGALMLRPRRGFDPEEP